MTYWGELSASTHEVDSIMAELSTFTGKNSLNSNDADRVLELLDQMIITREGYGGPEWPIMVWEVSFPPEVEQELRKIIDRAKRED